MTVVRGSTLNVGLAGIALDLDIQHWVNDLLRAGAEIKRGLVSGELRDRHDAMLPILAALGESLCLRSSL